MIKSLDMRWQGGRIKALTLSYDDGTRHDEKMVEILDRHGIKCTFNLNNRDNSDRYWITPNEYNDLYKNHEIAVHGQNHIFMKNVPFGTVVDEVIANRLQLEEITGERIQGMAYPYGPYNEDIIEALKLCGIKYSRTTPVTHKFELPENWYGWEGTCHHQDEKLFELCDKFLALKEPEESWRRISGRVFYMWGHSYEFDRNDNWDRLEEFCRKMGGHKDVWYATNMEIYNYVEAYRSLEFNVNLTKVHNPTATDVWFSADKVTILVKAGETIDF